MNRTGRAGFRRLVPMLVQMLVMGAAFPTEAALRPPNGGLLRLGTVDPVSLETLSSASPESTAIGDRPIEVAVRAFTHVPLCRLDAQGQLISGLAKLTASSLRRWTFMLSSGAQAITNALEAWSKSGSAYRGLLAPFLQPSGQLKISLSTDGQTLTLESTFDWPDAPKALCHPAFWMPPKAEARGPFIEQKDGGSANAQFLRGRPFLDGFRQLAQQERAASRLFRLKQLDIALGLGTDAAGGHPYVTYLGFAPIRRAKPLMDAVAGMIDKTELARGFVRAPAIPWSPWPLALSSAAPSPGAPGAIPTELRLMFDAGSEDARAVAERLLLKLRAAGTKLLLQPVSRTDLWNRWHSGEGFDLALLSVLLPTDAPNTLAVLLELSGMSSAAYKEELAAVGALPSPEARASRASNRLQALGPHFPFLPLYAQGLSWSVGKRVQGLTVDGQGIPFFEDVYLLPE